MSPYLRICSVVGVLVAGVLTSLPAAAVVLTFEELPHDQELQGAGPTVLSKGFVLQYAPAPGEPFPVGFTVVGPSWPFNGRSAALEANSCSATTTLTDDDNNPLSLVSIEVAAANGDLPVEVTFVGLTAEGSTVDRRIRLRDQGGWQRFIFPQTFRNLQSVTWTQGDCVTNFPHMFDNILVFRTWNGGGE